jgi:hypothetical protein
MSQPPLVACPGCGEPFRAGRGIALHFHWRPVCCIVETKDGDDDSPIQFEDGDDHMSQESHPFVAPVDTYRHLGDTTTERVPEPSGDEVEGPPKVLWSPDHDLQDVVRFPPAYTTAQKYEVQLLKIIHSIGAPNGSFQMIMDWAQAASTNGYDFHPTPKQYERQINHVERFVGMEACRPTEVSVPMYPCLQVDDKLEVVVFDFPTMLASLFNCPLLNKLENLVVNPHNRFGKYSSPDGRLGEINSGQWYDTAYKTLIKDPDKDFLCPIIFTMDKTVISEMGGLSVYVILFTTSIFNRKVCVGLSVCELD